MMKIFMTLSLLIISGPLYALSVADLQVRWSSVYSKTVMKRFITVDPITEPPGARIVLAQLDLLTKNFKKITDCIIYEVPSRDKAGRLFIIQKKSTRSCEDVKFQKSIYKRKNIFNLKLQEQKQKLKIFIDQTKISFNFFNIIDESIQGDDPNYQFKVPGVMVSFVQDTSATSVLNEFDICSDVPSSESCFDQGTNLCHLCPEGKSYLVVASDCNKSVRRYCGQKQCGQVNMPACIRGRAATGYAGPFCITDSPVAFCTKPARVVCLNNELYCR